MRIHYSPITPKRVVRFMMDNDGFATPAEVALYCCRRQNRLVTAWCCLCFYYLDKRGTIIREAPATSLFKPMRRTRLYYMARSLIA